MSKNRIICIEKHCPIARWFINRYALLLLVLVTVLIGTSFSFVFASSWNIQTVEYWGDNGTGNSIALDSLGRVHISYLEFDYLARIYYLKYAFWDGNAWQRQSLAQNGDLPGKTSLVLDSNDRPHICYTYSRLGYPAVLGYAKWNGSNWESLAVDYGASGSLSLDNYDRPHISYSYPYSVIINNVRVSRSDLKYAYWNGQNWQTQTIEYGGRIGEENSLALDSQMRPHIAYRDFGVESGHLKYAAWNGLAWQIQIVDNQGDAGKNPSLALDSVDRPCITYAGGDYSLKYASHNGATWQIQTVEASVAQYFLPNSLALDQDDCPHISYQNNGLSLLKYAVWDGSGWRIEIVDSSNKPGSYNSLALDSGNRPHISYYEVINGDLKYATIDVDMQDGDGDGLFDYIENATCTDPFDVDSDDDGISDGEEDLNHNGMVDGSETDPCNADSDGDGLQDGTEKGIISAISDPDDAGPLLGTDINIFIQDADPSTTTDPTNADSDGDGFSDGTEDTNHNGMVDVGETDPNNKFDHPSYNLSVTKAGTGSGTVTSIPSGIDCGDTCSASYDSGTLVTLTAIPDTGFTFTVWSGDCSGTGDCTVTMDAVKNVAATFSVPAVPEISVEGNGTIIPDGDTNPSNADHTDFGSADIDTGSITRTFTIHNTGMDSLSLSGTPMVTLSGIHVNDFSVTAQPTSPIAAGDSTTFQVRFDPSVVGLRQTNISISNTDCDENPYDFNIQGTGINPVLSPTIESLTTNPDPVTIGSSLILTANGVSDPTPDDTLTTHFYRESNGLTGLQVGQDTLVGTDTDSINGWAVNVQTSGLTAGSYTYYAQVTDAAGLTSSVVETISVVQLLDLNQVGHWGGAAWAVEIEGTIAYVGQGQSLLLFDISQPSAPLEMGRVILPDGVTDIVVSGAYAYVAIGHGGLQVINISTPSSPVVVGTYGTRYVRAVDVSGDFAYLVEDSFGLEVLDISEPSNPVHVGGYDDADTTYDVVVSGNFAYVAYGYDGLKVFDISVPANLVQVGGYLYDPPDGASDMYWSVDLANNYIFLTAEATPGSRTSLYVVDISVPSNPIHTGVYDTTGYNYTYVSVFGDYAYLANRTYGFEIIDISVPSIPTQVTKYDTDGAGRVSDVAVSSNYAYIANGSNGLQVFDISTPSSPIPVAVTTNSTACLHGVAVLGNYVYTGGGLFDAGLHLIDISKPSKLTRVGFYGELGSSEVFAVSGDYAYVWSDDDELEVIDFSTPSSPIRVGSVETSYRLALDVTISGNYAFVAVQQGGLDVVDISMPSNPVRVGGYNTTGLAYGVAVSGNYAYVADGLNGLQVLDISSPSSPVRIGGCDTDHFANKIAVEGNHAYIADGDSGLQVIDITFPANPMRVGNYDTPYAYDVAVSGNYAYLVTSGSGLYIIDISEPSTPSLAGRFDTAGFAYGVAISGDYTYIADCSNGLVILNGALGNTHNPDEDGDGLSDDIEDATCTDPHDADSDDDGISDGIEDANHNGELNAGETDPCDSDSDGDGIQDGTETGYTLMDIWPDTDTGFFIPDADPSTTTNPTNTDSDGDGIDDGGEDKNYNGKIDPFETNPAIESATHETDIDNDGDVDGFDLLLFIIDFGNIDCNNCPSDFTSDGSVNTDDLVIFSKWYGTPFSFLEWRDSDLDLILDDGDFSGIAGDNPCFGGNTIYCDDNCIENPNFEQFDSDGDGIGDKCD